MRLAIFTPFLYPFHVDMLAVISGKAEVKIFTCGTYGNYPFKSLLRCAEVLKCIDILGDKLIGFFSISKFLRYKPKAVIIFGIESLAGLIIYFISRLIRAKTLVIVEENNITRLNNIVLELLQIMKRGILRIVYERSPILVAESSASKKYVLEILHVKRKKPIIIRVHGVNADRFGAFVSMPREQAKKILQKILRLPENLLKRKWYTFIGELSYCKGADVLLDGIEILREILKPNENVVFLLPKTRLLHDKKELRERYKRKLMRLVTNGSVALYDPLRHEDVPLLYRASDVIILPSRFLSYTSSDRAPNVALEALASGTLLVASNVGGIPTIVGDAGIVVKPNDPYALATKLYQVLNNYEKYRSLEEKARQRAISKLDIRHYSYALLELLKL